MRIGCCCSPYTPFSCVWGGGEGGWEENERRSEEWVATCSCCLFVLPVHEKKRMKEKKKNKQRKTKHEASTSTHNTQTHTQHPYFYLSRFQTQGHPIPSPPSTSTPVCPNRGHECKSRLLPKNNNKIQHQKQTNKHNTPNIYISRKGNEKKITTTNPCLENTHRTTSSREEC